MDVVFSILTVPPIPPDLTSKRVLPLSQHSNPKVAPEPPDPPDPPLISSQPSTLLSVSIPRLMLFQNPDLTESWSSLSPLSRYEGTSHFLHSALVRYVSFNPESVSVSYVLRIAALLVEYVAIVVHTSCDFKLPCIEDFLNLPQNEDVLNLPQIEDVTALPRIEDGTELSSVAVIGVVLSCFEAGVGQMLTIYLVNGLYSFCIYCLVLLEACRFKEEATQRTMAYARQLAYVCCLPKSARALSQTPSPMASHSLAVSVLMAASLTGGMVRCYGFTGGMVRFYGFTGGMVWNSVRLDMQGSTSYHLLTSAFMAEVLALKTAMEAASLAQIPHITMCSDSQVLVNLLILYDLSTELKCILFDIRCLLLAFASISFVSIPRSANEMADSMAKNALGIIVSSS